MKSKSTKSKSTKPKSTKSKPQSMSAILSELRAEVRALRAAVRNTTVDNTAAQIIPGGITPDEVEKVLRSREIEEYALAFHEGNREIRDMRKHVPRGHSTTQRRPPVDDSADDYYSAEKSAECDFLLSCARPPCPIAASDLRTLDAAYG
jgi:hypothetical protein